MLSSSGVLLRRSCTAACAGNQRLLVGGPAGGLASLASASVRVPGGARAAGWKSASFGQAARAFSGYWPTADGAHGMHGTTILSVRRNGKVVVIGDGQISQGPTVVKGTAIKVRRLGGDDDKSKRIRDDGSVDQSASNAVLAGFAGSTADALTLIDRLERKIEQYPGQLIRSCVELAKLWRTDKYLRRLEAILIVVDKDVSLTVTGTGDVIQSEDGIIAVGSGGLHALSAARALADLEDSGLSAEDIARRSMKVASNMCVYTNDQYTIEILDTDEEKEASSS